MEVVGNVIHCDDADVMRHQIIQPHYQSAVADLEGNVGMRTLRTRMHAGVRAAGAFDVNGRAKHFPERFLDDLLDRERIRLALPAGVPRAEVLKREEKAHEFILSAAKDLRWISRVVCEGRTRNERS